MDSCLNFDLILGVVRMRERKEAERKSIYFSEDDSDILKYALANSEKLKLSLS